MELSGSTFLIEIFNELHKNSIEYCVLRNYESLPYDTGGSDIDVLVKSKDAFDFITLLHHVARSHGGKAIIRLKANRVLSISLCGFDNKWWGVKFDIFSSYVGTNSCDILSSQDIFERKFEYNGIMVADAEDSAIVAFLKEIIGAGKTRKQYESQAAKAFSINRPRYEKPLKYFWGNDLFYNLLEPLLRGELENYTAVKKQLKKGWLLNMLKKQPVLIVRQRLLDFYFRVYRVFFPVGFSVAFIGTDGSGKSTIIEGIRPPLEAALHSKLKYEHLRPNLLPSLSRLFGGKPHELGKSVENPHAAASSGFVGSLLRLIYYSLDYILGYWFKVFPNMVKKPCLYVFDRYFYDLIVDPSRSRVSLPRKLVEFFQVMIPKPDLILCLGADPEIIYARKPELPLIEVVRQVEDLRQFCDKIPGTVWIDTGGALEESVNQSLAAIVDRMAARYV